MTPNEIKDRCLNAVNTMRPGTEMNDSVTGWVDDLDFVGIVMETEEQLNCEIYEGDKRIYDFNRVSDLVAWLASQINTKQPN